MTTPKKNTIQPFSGKLCHFERVKQDGRWPSARSGHRIVADCQYIYCFGGLRKKSKRFHSNEQRLFTDIWRFNRATDTWTQLTTTGQKPAHTAYASVLLLNSTTLLVFGGSKFPTGFDCTNAMYILDLVELDWNLVKYESDTVPPFSYGQAMVLDKKNGCLYLYGGKKRRKFYGSMYRFDLVSNEWSRLANCKSTGSSARAHHSMALWDEKLYIVGEKSVGTERNCMKRISVFNLATCQWISEALTPFVTTISLREEMHLLRHGVLRNPIDTDEGVSDVGDSSDETAGSNPRDDLRGEMLEDEAVRTPYLPMKTADFSRREKAKAAPGPALGPEDDSEIQVRVHCPKRLAPAVAQDGPDLYILGGIAMYKGEPYNDFWSLHLPTLTLTFHRERASTLSFNLVHTAAAACDGELFLFGGLTKKKLPERPNGSMGRAQLNQLYRCWAKVPPLRSIVRRALWASYRPRQSQLEASTKRKRKRGTRFTQRKRVR